MAKNNRATNFCDCGQLTTNKHYQCDDCCIFKKCEHNDGQQM